MGDSVTEWTAGRRPRGRGRAVFAEVSRPAPGTRLTRRPNNEIRHGLATDGNPPAAARSQHARRLGLVSQSHDVTVIDHAGTIQARFAIGYDEASLHGLLEDAAGGDRAA